MKVDGFGSEKKKKVKGFCLSAIFSLLALILVATSIGPVFAATIDDESSIGFFCKYWREALPFETYHCDDRPLIRCPFGQTCGFWPATSLPENLLKMPRLAINELDSVPGKLEIFVLHEGFCPARRPQKAKYMLTGMLAAVGSRHCTR